MTSIKKILIVAAALALGACSFDVVNPGPVGDPSLNNPGAYTAIVNGVRYNLSRAIGINTFYSAIAAKEYSTSGRVNATKLPLVFGQLTVDDMSANTWNWSQAARWQAEDGARRLQDTLGAAAASNRFAGQLLMYGALANRVLGDNFCEAVIDGGSRAPNSVHYQRADSLATQAIAVATAAADVPTRQAAYGIRAAARLALGQYANAAADAATGNIPTAFVLNAPFDQAVRNLIVDENDFAVGGNFRATSVWRSFFEGYFRTTGDLRVRWDSSTLNGKARDGEFTGIPWLYPRKYILTGTAADYAVSIRLVSGREMPFIQAEAALRTGDFATAATFINSLRTPALSPVRAGSPALSNWTITNVREGWNALRREKSIELWLEARTMADLRRWIADGTYQAQFDLTPFGTGVAGSPDDVSDRIRMCFPISRGERQTNPNLPDDPTNDDPKSPISSGVAAVW